MMIPALLILRAGPGRGIPIPLPLFLLWPFALLAAAFVAAAYLVTIPFGVDRRPFVIARHMGRMLLDLHGLRIDVRSHDGTRVYFWIV